jgi:hypothetical protein
LHKVAVALGLGTIVLSSGVLRQNVVYLRSR